MRAPEANAVPTSFAHAREVKSCRAATKGIEQNARSQTDLRGRCVCSSAIFRRVVFSHALQHPDWANTTVTDRDPAEAISGLKRDGT